MRAIVAEEPVRRDVKNGRRLHLLQACLGGFAAHQKRGVGEELAIASALETGRGQRREIGRRAERCPPGRHRRRGIRHESREGSDRHARNLHAQQIASARDVAGGVAAATRKAPRSSTSASNGHQIQGAVRRDDEMRGDFPSDSRSGLDHELDTPREPWP